MKLNTIVRFLNKELGVSKIDGARNGLQVKGSEDVQKIVFSVDASMELFEKAKAKKCNLVIVHHGLFWKGIKDSFNLRKKAIAFLKRNGISLYASHHPIDSNITYGNNSELARIIKAKNLKKFGLSHGLVWGWQGIIKPISLNKAVSVYNKALKTKFQIFNFGKSKIKSIAFCSGGGTFWMDEAKKKKIDLIVTGEMKHMLYHKAKELKLNIIAGGHYKTEMVGVKALMELLKEKFKIKTEFIDVPTGL